jgi:Mn-dependent DtxR family transcriptional regulator
MHDRAEGDELRITQEYLSYMLGVHRPAVTLAAGQLHKAGFIDYSRGKIRIANRIGLESAACVCYRAVRANHESLLGPDITAV